MKDINQNYVMFEKKCPRVSAPNSVDEKMPSQHEYNETYNDSISHPGRSASPRTVS